MTCNFLIFGLLFCLHCLILANLCQSSSPRGTQVQLSFLSPPIKTDNQRNSYLYSLSVKLLVKTISPHILLNFKRISETKQKFWWSHTERSNYSQHSHQYLITMTVTTLSSLHSPLSTSNFSLLGLNWKISFSLLIIGKWCRGPSTKKVFFIL